MEERGTRNEGEFKAFVCLLPGWFSSEMGNLNLLQKVW